MTDKIMLSKEELCKRTCSVLWRNQTSEQFDKIGRYQPCFNQTSIVKEIDLKSLMVNGPDTKIDEIL